MRRVRRTYRTTFGPPLRATFISGDLGCTRRALISSNEYSVSSSTELEEERAGMMVVEAGVIAAVCIGMDTVEGVVIVL